jgi:polyphosphate kinase 2
MTDSTKPVSASTAAADDPSQFETPSLDDNGIAEHEIDRMDVIRRFENGMYPYQDRIKKSEYEKEKALLQVELLKVQRWVKETGKKVVVLFEGRDAAGKGGAIKRFMEHLNPRGARVVALEKPTEAEQTQWYFQRYINHLPSAGEIVMLDRSWYNRAGVERVMGFCDPTAYLEFMRQCPEIERMLVRSGILLFKYWFSVTQD